MFVLAERYGRLGNRLLLSAHLLATSIENRQSFCNLAFYDYAKHFKSTSQDLFCRYPARKTVLRLHGTLGKLIYLASYAFCFFLFQLQKSGTKFKNFSLVKTRGAPGDLEFIDLDTAPFLIASVEKKQTVFFQGWFMRGFGNLEKHGDEIRDYFTPLESYRIKVDALIENLRKECDLLIGIVVRHGDYEQHLDGKYYYPLTVYTNVMEELVDLFKNKKVKFLICSDEQQDTRAFANFDYYFRSQHMIENLYSLAKCDYLVSPPSTYGMWASFYGRVPLFTVRIPGKAITLNSFKRCNL